MLPEFGNGEPKTVEYVPFVGSYHWACTRPAKWAMFTVIVPPAGRYEIASVPSGVEAVVTYVLEPTFPVVANVPYPAVTILCVWSGISRNHGRPANSLVRYPICTLPGVSRWSFQPLANCQV